LYHHQHYNFQRPLFKFQSFDLKSIVFSVFQIKYDMSPSAIAHNDHTNGQGNGKTHTSKFNNGAATSNIPAAAPKSSPISSEVHLTSGDVIQMEHQYGAHK